MAADIWFVSDTHFFHSNMLKFLDDKGKRIRHQYQSVEEMHEDIVAKWQAVVKPNDTVYHMGDVTFRYDGPFNELMSRLPGQKNLVIGNHDKLKAGGEGLLRWFQKVSIWYDFRHFDFTVTHIPLMLSSLRGGSHFCVHGHIHQKLLKDPHYINLCVEHTNYAPVHLDEVRRIIAERS